MKYKTYSKQDIASKKVALKPGNFIVTHGTSFIDVIIWIFTNSRWNHAALVVSTEGNIIELQTKGIQRSTIKQYPANEFYLVDLEVSDEDRKQIVSYAEFMLKKHSQYGFLTIATIAFKIMTHSRLVIKLDGTLICSEFVAKALAEGGVIWDKDTSLITPADLYSRFVRE